MQTKISFDLPESTLRIGFLEAFNINVRPSTEKYQQTITKDIEEMLKPGYAYPDNMQKGVRSLLKTFGFHPSGRSRPASEYLFKDLTNRGSFNYINNIVDINNHISLKYKLPISVFDLDKSGFDLCLRVGGETEEYIFNQEGQILTLKKLLLVAKTGAEAIGTPVKDSQATKVFEPTKKIAFFVYSSSNITSKEEMEKILNEIGKYLQEEAGATDISSAVLDAK
jgi:DNA/RNA-binding domain of Phe-tRNA-synthetase-like protein